MRPAFRLVFAAALAMLLPARASALSCHTNSGGPEEIQIVLQSTGSDIDVGWRQDAHNVGVPLGSSIRVCLDNCDTTSDPACDISGTIEGITSGTTTIGPPLPFYVDDREIPVCAVIQLAPPGVTGTANVQTGAIDGSGTIDAKVFLGACPQCSGTAAGQTGTCQGGASNGAPCTTEQVTRVLANTDGSSGTPDVEVDYRVSRGCLPSGNPFTISQTITVATSAQMVNQPCPDQVSGTNGYHECGVAGCVNTCTMNPGANGGVAQNCCNNQTTACFPDVITRTGSASAPTPAFPDTTYPKSSDVTLAGAFCIGSVNPLLVDPEIGAPGPMALLWPGTAQWRTDSDADGLYDDLDVTCPFDADCDDDGLLDGALSGSEDLDEDGVVDPGETDPENFDSDGDGLPDGLEKGLTTPELSPLPGQSGATNLAAGHFTADADPDSTTDPNDADSDDDGTSDGDEDVNKNGQVDQGEGDPNSAPPTTTTTSTTLPGCADDAACSDGDPCTQDVCTAPTCSNPPLTGTEGSSCQLGKALAGPHCEGDGTLDAKTSGALAKALQKAKTAVDAAATATGKKRTKQLKKAAAALKKILKKIGKVSRKKTNPLSAECASELTDLLNALRSSLPTS